MEWTSENKSFTNVFHAQHKFESLSMPLMLRSMINWRSYLIKAKSWRFLLNLNRISIEVCIIYRFFDSRRQRVFRLAWDCWLRLFDLHGIFSIMKRRISLRLCTAREPRTSEALCPISRRRINQKRCSWLLSFRIESGNSSMKVSMKSLRRTLMNHIPPSLLCQRLRRLRARNQMRAQQVDAESEGEHRIQMINVWF